MPYIGNQPADRFGSLAYQDLTGVTGSPVKRGFTLNQAVANEMELEVFVNNVRQEPTDAYTVSGTTLTMTGDVETTDDFYVVFQGKAIGTVTHPSNTPIVDTTGTFSGALSATTGTFSGAVSMGSNNITFSDGSGIDFSASAGSGASSSILDDYEEGTFTPTATPGSGSYTTTDLQGRYTKVGRLVAFQIYFTITTVGTGSGSVTISGLPFTSLSWYRMPNKWRENAATGLCGQFTMNSGQATGFMQNDDGSNITHASGRVFLINGLYYSA